MIEVCVSLFAFGVCKGLSTASKKERGKVRERERERERERITLFHKGSGFDSGLLTLHSAHSQEGLML